jgi:hypothetical protein
MKTNTKKIAGTGLLTAIVVVLQLLVQHYTASGQVLGSVWRSA